MIPKSSKEKEKTIEETYQKLTPIEHVLARPDTYVGSLQKTRDTMWVAVDDEQDVKIPKLQERDIEFSPALYKIYDEVLVNAADSYNRDKSMTELKIEVNRKDGYVKVLNNGKGIPVVMHEKHKQFIPQMIFGQLFTGSNFNDSEQRFGGGRNGFGAKLANILSQKFTVKCGDSKTRKKFFMEWSQNMLHKQQPVITPYEDKKDFVEIVFYPDFQKFGMTEFEDDTFNLFRKRAYDMAGILPNVKVSFNKTDISFKNFQSYVDMYLGTGAQVIKIKSGKDDNKFWEVIFSRSDGEARQVSFVNSICTSKGGTHTNYVLDQIVPKISEKLKNKAIKPQFIKSKLWVFINCSIANPSFDSQLKQTLTTKSNVFGSTWEMPEKMIKMIMSTGIVQELQNQAEARQMTKMQKTTAGGKKGRIDVPKLEDANDAGKKDSDKCVLILTEGDSAKALAVSGLSVLGRDKYGVFPLRGKLLNVREKEKKVVLDNAEITNLVKIIGLQYNKTYDDLKSLRYGSIMIMTDQDSDGSHIKGLIINFIQYFWPSLFKTKGFLREFITPLMKVTKKNQTLSFFSVQEYNDWKRTVPDPKKWKIKYYKGLGTSTSKEGQEYFKNLDIHQKIFKYEDEADEERFDMAFSKKKADERKNWLANYDESDVLDMAPQHKYITYKDFVNKQLIHFSNSSNKRAIPSVVDGLKPGQRKIIFSCFKRNLTEEIKVAQLAGYVAEHSAYHHGEMALTETIIGLAQNFTGANNINLLMPNGQFGSRAEGGSDHASARYIFTCLSRLTRVIFPQADDHSLEYIEDDGQLVQPKFYIPILPMILVNGAEGVGTGWSTTIHNYNPLDIVDSLKSRINGEEFKSMTAWYKGFDGNVTTDDGGFKTWGVATRDPQHSNVLHVTELPVGKWTIKMKEDLNQFIKKQKYITNFKQHHTQNKVHFELEFDDGFLQQDTEELKKVYEILKLGGSKKASNMVAFTSNNQLRKYVTVLQIMEDFYHVRMQAYEKRKKYLVSKLKRDVEIINNKTKFILEMVNETFKITRKNNKLLVNDLYKRGYTRYSDFTKVLSTKIVEKGSAENKPAEGEDLNEPEKEKGEEVPVGSGEITLSEYKYLLDMPMSSICEERVEYFVKTQKEKQQQLDVLLKTTEPEMWLEDLILFQNSYKEVLEEEIIERQNEEALAKGNKKNKGKGAAQKKGKGMKKAEEKDGEKEKEKEKKKPNKKVETKKSSVSSDRSQRPESKSIEPIREKKNNVQSKLNFKPLTKEKPNTNLFKDPNPNSKNPFSKPTSVQSSPNRRLEEVPKSPKKKPSQASLRDAVMNIPMPPGANDLFNKFHPADREKIDKKKEKMAEKMKYDGLMEEKEKKEKERKQWQEETEKIVEQAGSDEESWHSVARRKLNKKRKPGEDSK